ncbi:hypothetical protein IRT45_10730 [Nocardia sp. BSTN01]|uniref:hypothetical protein n=1 Tax=Nocardia sp. BSTN01 TaxID=2783665 RepID=UPI00188EDDF1|nr:hypothetical protein [Nocardia sp. BSTN01]MBF4997632.1 hypothetical protein [Nocardia sp. BSTN01]
MTQRLQPEAALFGTLTGLAEINDVLDATLVAVLREGMDERVAAGRAIGQLSELGTASEAVIGPSR